MAHPSSTTNTVDLGSDPRGYQVDDLTVDLAPRRVTRGGAVIRLQALSFDLLVTLVRAAPTLVSFEQLNERVWPGLVITPETIVQRVKLLRGALGDDPHAPRYIEGVRGRGYRMLAEVQALTERHSTSEFAPNVHIAASEVLVLSSPSTMPRAAPRPPGWIGGTLVILALLAASWATVHYRGGSKPSDRTSVVVSPVIQSLAVLPLENLSGDKEQEYFADGMTDELITNLAQIASLRVISRTSAMHFKGSRETLPQIGRDLQVDAILEGTVARSENRVRVTAKLVAASSDRHLWARTYERDLKDVLALQDEIAQDITEQVRVKLSPKERTLLLEPHSVDPEAHDAYLRGRYWWSKRGADVWKGLDYFQKAIAADPSYALAYVGVADSFFTLGSNGNLSPKEAFLKAKDAVTKALELDPSLAPAHASLALVEFFHDRDWSAAEREFKRALALNSNEATAHQWYSTYLTALGRFDEALKEIERARELDPFSSPVNWWSGRTLYYARRYDDALRQFQRNAEMFPTEFEFYNNIADVYEHKRMFAEAFAARQRALSMQHDPTVTDLARAYARAGYRGWLLKKIEILEQAPPETVLTQQKESHLPMFKFFGIAYFYALLDDEPHCMAYLERANDGGNSAVLFLRVSPNWDSVRNSPRFRDLLHRIGYPPSANDSN